ncbi:MAG: V-type ATP synthase subunit I [Phycisphaerae bacterium]|mgnify:FL=1|nr:V-type ATP synthase subunit I [Phycisphaerae bacterium]
MAITPMAKVLIVSHRSQVGDLLAALQAEGICQILNADEATISKDAPGLTVGRDRPRDVEELLARLERSIGFLKEHALPEKGSLFMPRKIITVRQYDEIISDPQARKVLEEAEQVQAALEKARAEIEHLQGLLDTLRPWLPLQTPVEELTRLRTTISWAGLVPGQHFDAFQEQVTQAGAGIQRVGPAGTREAVIVVAMREQSEPVQKLLRSHEFETVTFEPMTGTVAELIAEHERKLADARGRLEEHRKAATALSANLLTLQVLCDHYRNMLGREQKRDHIPATEQTMILEGWCKVQDYARLEKAVSQFDAASLMKVDPAAGEEPPIEIENHPVVRPFETITRLYGLPVPTSLDPTVFLAPFFAIFFGLCLADVGYGLLLIALLIWASRKVRGNKTVVWLLLMCGVTTAIAGAITGGWFSDATTSLIPAGTGLYKAVNSIRESIMLFDPMTQPMTFFALSLGLGYLQIQFGLFIALIFNLRKKDIVAAVCDQLTWIVMLNCLLGLGLSKAGILPASLARVFGFALIFPAFGILFFSERNMPIGGRLGMGAFNLFSTVFFGGDILSYVRLMALGMVGAGFGMAVNVLVKLVSGAPYVGWLLGALVFVGGHVFNLGLSMLGAFVHSLRLQFVEFFPKFFQGGGQAFTPLRNDYRYVFIE